MLKFLDKISVFPLLPVTSIENSPMEVFHILTPKRRKLNLIIKDFDHITHRHTPPLQKPVVYCYVMKESMGDHSDKDIKQECILKAGQGTFEC